MSRTSASHSHTPNSNDWCQTPFNPTPPAHVLKIVPAWHWHQIPTQPHYAHCQTPTPPLVFSRLFGSSARQRQSEALQHWNKLSLFGPPIRKNLPGATGALEPPGNINTYRNTPGHRIRFKKIHFLHQNRKQNSLFGLHVGEISIKYRSWDLDRPNLVLKWA